MAMPPAVWVGVLWSVVQYLPDVSHDSEDSGIGHALLESPCLSQPLTSSPLVSLSRQLSRLEPLPVTPDMPTKLYVHCMSRHFSSEVALSYCNYYYVCWHMCVCTMCVYISCVLSFSLSCVVFCWVPAVRRGCRQNSGRRAGVLTTS